VRRPCFAPLRRRRGGARGLAARTLTAMRAPSAPNVASTQLGATRLPSPPTDSPHLTLADVPPAAQAGDPRGPHRAVRCKKASRQPSGANSSTPPALRSTWAPVAPFYPFYQCPAHPAVNGPESRHGGGIPPVLTLPEPLAGPGVSVRTESTSYTARDCTAVQHPLHPRPPRRRRGVRSPNPVLRHHLRRWPPYTTA